MLFTMVFRTVNQQLCRWAGRRRRRQNRKGCERRGPNRYSWGLLIPAGKPGSVRRL